jgi:pimeloyl-ACP methyl ester carboxylesterase
VFRHLPSRLQVEAVAKIAWLSARGRPADAAEVLLRAAYTYRDGGTAWDAFPEDWRRVARDNARVSLADFFNSVRNYPSARELATITVPVVCSYGARSPDFMPRRVRSLAAAIPCATTHRIEGSGHAAPFDATTEFVRLIADTMERPRPRLDGVAKCRDVSRRSELERHSGRKRSSQDPSEADC